jgi:hypothetical protein
MTFPTLQKDSIYALPIIHYTMELAAHVRILFQQLQPDCVAVELPEPLQEKALHAASRLPDISVIQADDLYYMCEPCDPIFEALRSALEHGCGAYCIDLDLPDYPAHKDLVPDPYATLHIGLKSYYEAYLDATKGVKKDPLDHQRELFMAKRLKELSFQYDKILFISGFYHVASVLQLLACSSFPLAEHAPRDSIRLATLTEDSCRDVMAEYGWISYSYELWRQQNTGLVPLLDRQQLIFHLYKSAAEKYRENTGNAFLGYHLRNTMKFARNYAFIHRRLLPDLFELLSAAKGCVDHNYAYETWVLATYYPFRKNIDNLCELSLSIEEVWGKPKQIRFHFKHKNRKGVEFQRRKKDRQQIILKPPSPFGICSYPPEDLIVENFGDFLKKKGNLLLSEEAGKTLPFTTSLEDGIDPRETIRHLYERKLYVKMKGRPPGGVGSVVMIFDEDREEELPYKEKFPWKMTWHGEHNQESDMAFYATHLYKNVVGPGISRCEYGGFMMTYPPRRLEDIWYDSDYSECQTKAELLLMAAIDYSVKPIVVFVAEKPPRHKIKRFASLYGKKIVYIPRGQLSPTMLNKLRVFHVLDGHDKREIAGDYVF